MARRLLLVAALVLGVAVVAGCGGSAGSSGGDPADAAPASSLFYGSIQIRPEGPAKKGAEAAGRKIFRGRDPGQEIDKLLERALEDADPKLSYRDDVKPWLGRRAAVAVTGMRGSSPDAVVLVATTDEGRARDAVDKVTGTGSKKRSYRDVDYRLDGDTAFAVLDGYLVAGTVGGLEATVDTLKGGRSLAESSSYARATRKVTTDGLGLLYLDTKHFFDVISRANPSAALLLQPFRALPQFRDADSVAAALTADGDAIRLEFPAGPKGKEPAADAIADLPADSWLAFAAPRAGDAIRAQVAALRGQQGGQIAQLEKLLRDQTGIDLDRDVLSWIKGLSIFASGTTLPDLRAGLILTTSDRAASRRAIAKIGRVLRREGLPVRPAPGGFELRPGGLPAPLSVTLKGDRVLAAYGRDVAGALARGGLERGAGYAAARKALGGGRPAFVLSVPAILEIARNLGARESAGYRMVEPYLEAFGPITAGVVERDGRRLGRLAVGLR